MSVWVVETQINEIERISETGKELSLCFFKNGESRHKLFLTMELNADVEIKSNLLKNGLFRIQLPLILCCTNFMAGVDFG